MLERSNYHCKLRCSLNWGQTLKEVTDVTGRVRGLMEGRKRSREVTHLPTHEILKVEARTASQKRAGVHRQSGETAGHRTVDCRIAYGYR